MLKDKVSFNIVTENTIIGEVGNAEATAYLNNCGRHLIINIEDQDAGNFELTINIITGRKTLYDIDRKEEIVDFKITDPLGLV